jgi:hypothetical protein
MQLFILEIICVKCYRDIFSPLYYVIRVGFSSPENKNSDTTFLYYFLLLPSINMTKNIAGAFHNKYHTVWEGEKIERKYMLYLTSATTDLVPNFLIVVLTSPEEIYEWKFVICLITYDSFKTNQNFYNTRHFIFQFMSGYKCMKTVEWVLYNISIIKVSQLPLLDCTQLTRPSQDIVWKLSSTLIQILIANAIFRHLYASDPILFNKVLISSENKVERQDETIF